MDENVKEFFEGMGEAELYLEIGPGFSPYLPQLAKKFPEIEIYLMDVSEGIIKFWKSILGLNKRPMGDLLKTEYKKMMHHLESLDVEREDLNSMADRFDFVVGDISLEGMPSIFGDTRFDRTTMFNVMLYIEGFEKKKCALENVDEITKGSYLASKFCRGYEICSLNKFLWFIARSLFNCDEYDRYFLVNWDESGKIIKNRLDELFEGLNAKMRLLLVDEPHGYVNYVILGKNS